MALRAQGDGEIQALGSHPSLRVKSPPSPGVSPERQRVQHEHPHAGAPRELLQRHPGAGPQGRGPAGAAHRRPRRRLPVDGHPREPVAACRHRRKQEKGRVWAPSPRAECPHSAPTSRAEGCLCGLLTQGQGLPPQTVCLTHHHVAQMLPCEPRGLTGPLCLQWNESSQRMQTLAHSPQSGQGQLEGPKEWMVQ